MILTQDEILQLAKALTSSFDYNANRNALMVSQDTNFLGMILPNNSSKTQVMVDLGWMNTFERIANGDIPLLIFLQNAAFLVSALGKEAVVIRTMLEKVQERALGVPTVDITTIEEVKEAIIHTDDTLPYSFINGAVTAAAGVAKLSITAYVNNEVKQTPNGNNMIFAGSGWLISKSLIITNHHVINARQKGEAPASDQDLLTQVANSFALMDFDDDDTPGTKINFSKLEAWNTQLDYAVIRTDANRIPLRIKSDGVGAIKDPVPVNIIQHPGGRSKRFAIRNNLVSSSIADELRYFTDTEGGSSGSPVFNDTWEVVALHRASVYTPNVKFQGKSTAYVNVGTQIGSILKDLQNRYPVLYNEITGVN